MIRRCSLFNSPCSSSNVVFTSFPPLASFAEIGFVRGRPGKWFSACTLRGHGEPLHPGIRPCEGTRQRGDPRPARMGSRPAGRLGPCRTALRDELALPSDVVGPRLQRPFRRLGSRLASLIMPAPMAPFVPFSFYRDSRLYARRHSYARTRKIEDYSDSPGGATSNADVPSRSMAFSTKPDLLASSTNSFA